VLRHALPTTSHALTWSQDRARTRCGQMPPATHAHCLPGLSCFVPPLAPTAPALRAGIPPHILRTRCCATPPLATFPHRWRALAPLYALPRVYAISAVSVMRMGRALRCSGANARPHPVRAACAASRSVVERCGAYYHFFCHSFVKQAATFWLRQRHGAIPSAVPAYFHSPRTPTPCALRHTAFACHAHLYALPPAACCAHSSRSPASTFAWFAACAYARAFWVWILLLAVLVGGRRCETW